MTDLDTDRRANRLRVMEAIFAQTQDDATVFVALWDVREALDLTDDGMANAVDFLEGEGLITTLRTGTGQRTPMHAMITHQGVSWMEAQAEIERDPAVRVRAIRKALLVWLYQEKHQGTPMSPVAEMVTRDPAAKSPLPGELDRAAAQLAAGGMISGMTVDQFQGPVRAEITSEGEECVENYGADTGAYRVGSNGGSVFHIETNNGNIAASSNNVTQTVTSPGVFDPTQLLAFADLVRELAPSLAPNVNEREELLTETQRLRDSAAAPEPDRGRLQRIADGVLSLVRGLAHSPTVQRLALEAGEQAIQNSFH
jgi:hypothetical protein